MSRSPAKKQLMVSLTSQSTTTSITRNNNITNKQTNDLLGKSIENVYEKVILFLFRLKVTFNKYLMKIYLF